MCDYSLMSFPNRLAREGEGLVVHRFCSGSLGLASPADLQPKQTGVPPVRSWWAAIRNFFALEGERSVPAVCIPPASRLILQDIPERMQAEYKIEAEEEVVFQQIGTDVNTYRDAVQFQNGRVLRLQELREGQRVTVLDVGSPLPAEGDVTPIKTEAETARLAGR